MTRIQDEHGGVGKVKGDYLFKLDDLNALSRNSILMHPMPKREEIDLRNNADQLVYQTEKQLEELGDKIDKDSKDEILKLIDEIKSLKDSQDIDKLKEAIDSLNKKWAEISQKIYANNPESANQTADNTKNSEAASNQDNDIEDADFEVVDDEK